MIDQLATGLALVSSGALLYDAVDAEPLDNYSLLWCFTYIVSLFAVMRHARYEPLHVAIYLALVILSTPHVPDSRRRRVYEAAIVFVSTSIVCIV